MLFKLLNMIIKYLFDGYKYYRNVTLIMVNIVIFKQCILKLEVVIYFEK